MNECRVGVARPGPVVLVCRAALPVIARSGTLCRSYSVVPHVPSAHVTEVNRVVIAAVACVVSEGSPHEALFPELDTDQSVQLVQGCVGDVA